MILTAELYHQPLFLPLAPGVCRPTWTRTPKLFVLFQALGKLRASSGKSTKRKGPSCVYYHLYTKLGAFESNHALYYNNCFIGHIPSKWPGSEGAHKERRAESSLGAGLESGVKTSALLGSKRHA
ncbi:hypothetical protein K443DRAFT_273156 [Laccaria amethystina LaAM-08-1]|uniref:Uncharacterized protein n=1 Tax=Laccaria amethystina LaAM-08-1 TaxID=1095629 RepID=A0A0C9WKX7_9AGAR|nr:hypothetical protein K443DRAFT_273156 [Laccaria amethystina LaAM-08-1]